MSSRFAAIAFLLLLFAGPSLAAGRDEEPGWLGVLLDDKRSPWLAKTSERTSDPQGGVVIAGVVMDSPAERAGLRSRDRLLTVEGRPVRGKADLAARIRDLSPGDWIELTVERRGRARDLRVTLGQRPPRPVRLQRAWIGAEAIDLTPGLREHFGAPAEAGVMVSGIEPESPAEVAGLELGDIVCAIDDLKVDSIRQLDLLVARGGVGNEIEITLLRDGAEMVLAPLLEKAPGN